MQSTCILTIEGLTHEKFIPHTEYFNNVSSKLLVISFTVLYNLYI